MDEQHYNWRLHIFFIFKSCISLPRYQKEVSKFYDDAHDGYDYTKGRYSLRTFKLTGKPKQLIIQQHKEGKYSASYNKFKIKLTVDIIWKKFYVLFFLA